MGKCKRDIREYFRVYHKALTETENVLLSDLEDILARRDIEKRDIDRQIKEVETAKEFMENQLRNSVNQVLADNVVGLKQRIEELESSKNAIHPLKLKWKFNHILRNIHELCTIEEGTPLYAGIPIQWSMISNSTLRDCWDFSYDHWEQKYYFVDISNSEGHGKILVFDRLFRNVSSHKVKDVYHKTYIKTSEEFIFLTKQYSPPKISKYTKLGIERGSLAEIDLEGAPSKMDIFSGYLYTPRDSTIVRLDMLNFKIAAKIKISRRRKDSILEDSISIVDIKVSETEILLLFNSPTETAIHSFDHTGVFLREVIKNNRGLFDPLNFCVNRNGIIFIADGKVKVFNTLGRQIGSFGEEFDDNSNWAKCILLDANSSHILVLADLNGKCLHAY